MFTIHPFAALIAPQVSRSLILCLVRRYAAFRRLLEYVQTCNSSRLLVHVRVSSSVRHSVWPRSCRTRRWLAGGLAVCAARSRSRCCRRHFVGRFVGIASPLSFSHATIFGWCVWVFLLGRPAIHRMGKHLDGAPFRLLNLRWVRLYSPHDSKVTYVPRFPSDPLAFRAELQRLAPSQCPIFKYIQRRLTMRCS